MYTGEVFSEDWRRLMCERVGASLDNLYYDSSALYGTADAGITKKKFVYFHLQNRFLFIIFTQYIRTFILILMMVNNNGRACNDNDSIITLIVLFLINWSLTCRCSWK